MKVLFTGHHNPHYPTITEYIEQALEALGHEIVILDEGRYLLPGRVRQRSRFIERVDLSWFNRKVLRACERFRPDWFIASGAERILPSTVAALKGRGTRTVLWTTDAPMHFAPILRGAPAYDHVFCQGTEAIDILRETGISRLSWLPMACDPNWHRPADLTADDRSQYGHDVVFVGSHYPVREKLLEPLAGLDLAVWGPGWEKLHQGSPLKRRVRGGHTTPWVWGKIYSAARIVLSIHFRDPAGRVDVHQASPRVFEAMACGAFVISDRQRDVLSLFKDGEHLATADSPEEMREKVRYYLGHAGERERIARSGHEEVLRRHTYVQRIGFLLGAASVGGFSGQGPTAAGSGAGP